ncbi:MAG: methyltransferase domain-containing protein [Desulfovibrio sp.]|nr:methyltransferase domain-containing protein [Desulfovibrio sp.]
MKPAAPMTPDEMHQLATAFQKSRVLLTACDLGLFTALERGPASSDQLAAAIGADPRATDRLLNALRAMGLVEKRDGRFANAPVASRLLVESSPEFMGGLGHTSNVFRAWCGLTEAVRTGAAAPCRDPASLDPQAVRAFIRAMHSRAAVSAQKTAEALGLRGVRRVLDVGGGSGVFAMAMARAEPGLRATVLDLPAVTPLTRDYVAAAGFADRVDTRGGDYHEADFGQGYDLVFFSAVFHINSPTQNQQLIRKTQQALNTGGRIAILDFIMDRDRENPPFATFFALNMLVNTPCGDTYTEDELHAWLTAAGFADPATTPVTPRETLVTGVKR